MNKIIAAAVVVSLAGLSLSAAAAVPSKKAPAHKTAKTHQTHKTAHAKTHKKA